MMASVALDAHRHALTIMRCGRTFRLARTHPAHARSSGSETLSRSRSLAAYTIDMHESEFSEATPAGRHAAFSMTWVPAHEAASNRLQAGVVADPGGAVFLLFKPNTEEEPKPVAPMTPGHVGWHELYAGDLDREFAFYSR